MEYCNSRLQLFQDAEVSMQYFKKNKSLDCSNIPLAVCHTYRYLIIQNASSSQSFSRVL